MNFDLDVFKDLSIIIVTHKRVDRQITYKSFPEWMKPLVTVVTTKGTTDAQELKALYPGIRVVEAPVNTIEEKRQWIVENTKKSKVVMLDDDLAIKAQGLSHQYIANPDKGECKPDLVKLAAEHGEGATAKNFHTDQTFYDRWVSIVNLMDKYHHGGITTMLNHNRILYDSIEDENGFKYIENWRACQALFFRPETLKKENVKFTDFPAREDFGVTMSLITKGYPNAVTTSMAFNTSGSFSGEGGISGEEKRTDDKMREATQRFIDAFPKFVTPKVKEYSTGSRLEVICHWKKAYKDAVAKGLAK